MGAWVGKMWQMSAARWQEGGSSGHKLETEKLVWEGESKLTPSCRTSGQGARKDKEQEREWEEALWSGWHLCLASESVDLKGQEDNYLGGTKQLTANAIQRLQGFTEQQDKQLFLIQPLITRSWLLSQSAVLRIKATNYMPLARAKKIPSQNSSIDGLWAEDGTYAAHTECELVCWAADKWCLIGTAEMAGL